MPEELAVAGLGLLPALVGPRTLHPFRARRLALPLVGGASSEEARIVAGSAGAPFPTDERGRVTLDASARLHVHDFSVGGHRVRGLVGLVDLHGERLEHGSRETAGLLPHEAVDPARVALLTERLLELGLDAAPLLLLHRESPGLGGDGRGSLTDLLDEATARAPDVAGRDAHGAEHRLWAVTGSDLLERLGACVGRGRLLLADGHHRYAAHLALASRTPPEADGRALAMVTDEALLAPGLHPIHRVLVGATVRAVEGALARAGLVRDAASSDPARVRLDALPAGRVLVLGRTEGRRLSLATDPTLDVAEQVHSVLDPLLDSAPGPERASALGSASEGTHAAAVWRYHHDARSAVDGARADGGVALILPPPSLARAWRAALDGRLLPAKATSFQPKPPPGVLVRSWHDA